MVKKRRQSDPSVNDSDSTSDENFRSEKGGESSSKCVHLKRAVDRQKLLRKMKQSGVQNEKCVECSKTSNGDTERNDDDYALDLTLWMCLKCGTHLCGRTANQHALKHFEVN